MRAFPWVFAAIMGSAMTAVVTAVLTAVRGGNLVAWLENWLLACVVTIPVIVWLAPRARAWAAGPTQPRS